MPRMKEAGRATMPANPNTNLPVLPERFAIGGTEVRPEQFYVIEDHRPDQSGPWDAEAVDKLAWRDAATGLDCILLRQFNGIWGGFVAVPPSHPLYGFNADAIPAEASLSPHGGIDYAQECDEDDVEETRICHMRPPRPIGVMANYEGPEARNETDDAWWFGFAADKPGDLVPFASMIQLPREEGETYRTVDYMYDETTKLACQLRALDPDPTISPPPILGRSLPKRGRS